MWANPQASVDLLTFTKDILKGYLCYKMITSQMCHLRNRFRIFLFRKKIIFRSQDIQVFVFLINP